jgi:hypothetical protein
VVGALLAVVAAQVPGNAIAFAEADSAALIGSWRWVRSAGGLAGADETPPPTGWSRILYFRPDGNYSCWERDSVADYLLCQGKYALHTITDRSASGKASWVELAGWSLDVLPSELITFLDHDTIEMYPGGGSVGVSDALTHTYVRQANRPEPLVPGAVPKARRPPRLQKGSHGTYYVSMESAFYNLWIRAMPFYKWMDWQYPATVRENYAYAHYQTPSAVIGDFDGDDSLDVAIYGSTGYEQSKVLLLLTGKGKAQSTFTLSEPTLISPQPGGRRPALYLKLLPKGTMIRDATDKPLELETDAVQVARSSGISTTLYFVKGELRRGKDDAEAPWDPRAR